MRELENEGPIFEELERTFQQTSEDYDAKKKNIVGESQILHAFFKKQFFFSEPISL